VGHNSENPFENKENDVSMSSICRSIEIDLRQMLAETNVPTPLQPVGDILY
jgi:putative membrane protein